MFVIIPIEDYIMKKVPKEYSITKKGKRKNFKPRDILRASKQRIRNLHRSVDRIISRKASIQRPTIATNELIILAMQTSRAFSQGDWPNAEKHAKKLINLNPDIPLEIWMILVTSLRNQKRHTEADATIQAGLNKFPDSYLLEIEQAENATADKNLDKAVQIWSLLLARPELSPKHKEKIYIAYISTLLESGAISKANEIATQASDEFKESLNIAIAQTRVYMKKGDWASSSKAWDEIFSKNQNIPIGGWLLAINSYRNSKEFKKADDTIQNAYKLYDDIRLRIEWAENPTTAKDWDTALTRWQRLNEDFGDCTWVEVSHKLHIKFNLSVVKRIVNIDDYLKRINEYRTSKTVRKIAIVTSFTDNYDTLKIPEVLDDRFDYFVYTNTAIEGFGIYNIRPFSFIGKDNGRTIRFVKTHPHKLFPDYDIVIWIDASILITDDIFPQIDRFISSKKPIASTPHQHRSSIFEELEACILRKKDEPAIMKKQVERYKIDGFSGDVLAENGILMFNNRNKKLPLIVETWWNEINNCSKRDQLSFGYSLYKNKSTYHHIVDKPYNMRNLPGIILTPHHEKNEVLDELQKLIKKAQNV